MSSPGNVLNALFGHMVEAAAGHKETPLLFICRSGGRSHTAATTLAAAGFTRCYNVLEGFEGNPDAQGQRNHLAGWRQRGLPWRQN
jgi:rhodanese-related sulfurtransferase